MHVSFRLRARQEGSLSDSSFIGGCLDLKMAAGAPLRLSKAPPFFLYMIPGVSEVFSEDEMGIYI